MTPEAWQAISAIVGVLGTTTSAITVAMITRTRRDARRGAEAAETAASNTESVSNGFTGTMMEKLGEISLRQKRQDAKIEAIMDTLGQHLIAHNVPIIAENNRSYERWSGDQWGVSPG